MYQHLSDRVNKVVKLANRIAREYDQEYVGTEHVLLAIAREGTGVGAQILTNHGANEDQLKTEVDKLIKASLEDTWVFGRLPGTPHFKNVVARAIEEASKLKSKDVCTEHLLLGLLAEKGSVANGALRAMGISTKLLRQEIVKRTIAKET